MSEAKRTTKTAKPEAEQKDVALIPIYIPMLPDEVGVGEVDQRLNVTINGVNRIVLRGQTVYVTPAEYEDLYNSKRFERL